MTLKSLAVKSEPSDLPLKGPATTSLGFEAIFGQPKYKRNFFERVFTDIRPKEDRDGYHLIIHDPFTVASHASVNIHTLPNRSVEYFIDPKIVSHDESLADFSPDEFVIFSFC